MSNPMRGEAPLGDKTLVFNFNSLCALERETGLKLHMLLVMIEADCGFADLRDFVWAGLQDRQPGTTVEEAGDAIGAVGFKEAADAVRECLRACFPPEKKEKGKNPPKAA
jgi:hypothetical protein